MEERKLVKHKSYPDALKKCISYFILVPQYNSDIRLANVYIKLVSTAVKYLPLANRLTCKQ